MNQTDKPLILIVDDNPKNHQFIGILLQKNGYEPAASLSGIRALEFVNRCLPALILLDVTMPGMDGFEVCQKLKESEKTKYIPVIFLTARISSEDIAKGFEVGGVDYITKPFQPIELLARVKNHIEMKILRGFLPICSKCKSIRDDKGYWAGIEHYLEAHSHAVFSHGLCPDCSEELYGDQEWYKKRYKSKEDSNTDLSR
ncbi:response regulator [bacterium]|nr:response regulator [bacterium]